MSNSTTLLDLISSSQASKEVTANALFDAASPATLYGRRASTTANLVWGFYGGMLNIDGTLTAVADGIANLTNAATNYVEAVPTTGNVSVNTSNFTSANIPLYSIVTSGNLVSSYTDYRQSGLGGVRFKPASNGGRNLGEAALGFKELFLDYTNSATVGAVTINKASGRVNVANGATSLVVTNNLVTANSHVFVIASQNDTTGRVNSVVAAAGNFTINCTAPSANMSVDFVVFGAD
jgi:hypothetical protein